MDRSINKIELRGNVGTAPRINDVGGNKVIRFSLATNERFKDRNGVLKEETTWHNVVAWAGKGMPDFNAIQKGTCVSVMGRVRNVKYTNSEGEDKYFNEVLSNRLKIEDSLDLQM
jgi:single-strand DNA-binding protein